MKEREELNDQKMEGLRERMKRSEKNVYERVEQEYSEIVEEKEKQMGHLSNTVFELEQEIRKLREQIDEDRNSRELEMEGMRVREH